MLSQEISDGEIVLFAFAPTKTINITKLQPADKVVVVVTVYSNSIQLAENTEETSIWNNSMLNLSTSHILDKFGWKSNCSAKTDYCHKIPFPKTEKLPDRVQKS